MRWQVKRVRRSDCTRLSRRSRIDSFSGLQSARNIACSIRATSPSHRAGSCAIPCRGIPASRPSSWSASRNPLTPIGEGRAASILAGSNADGMTSGQTHPPVGAATPHHSVTRRSHARRAPAPVVIEEGRTRQLGDCGPGSSEGSIHPSRPRRHGSFSI
jgi:hypothetical protein